MRHANQAPLDRYTLVHAGVGYGVGRLGINWRLAVYLAVMFELVEDELKKARPEFFPEPTPDSTINKITDIGAFMAGYAVGHKQY